MAILYIAGVYILQLFASSHDGKFFKLEKFGKLFKEHKRRRKKREKRGGGERVKKRKKEGKDRGRGQIEKKKGEKIGKRFFPSWEDILQ